MARGNPLSVKQNLLLERLKKEGKIRWAKTEASQSQTLCSLVKRGLAEVHGLDRNGNYCEDSFWTPK